MENEDTQKSIMRRAVECYADCIFRVAYQYLGNRQDCEDIVQEVFLALVKRLRLDSFNDDEHMKAWLIRVAINKSINFVKYNARRRTCPICIAPQPEGENFSALYEELNRLPAEDREIIYLHYYEGYTAKEIARFIGSGENAVYKRLSRAREKLKNYFTEGE